MPTIPDAQPRYPVRLVARRTGLTPHVLRAWERRYGVVVPARSEGGQRLYSDADIRRLELLRRLTDAGHSIARLARLPAEELAVLVEATPMEPRSGDADDAREREPGVAVGEHPLYQQALAAVDAFDAERLGDLLERSIVSLGVPQALDRVVAPLLGEIGRRWRSGRLGVAHEHLATAVVRRVLGWVMASATVDPGAPGVVVATPSRQVHELGAMMAAAEGWRIAYLGADLPVREVALAAGRIRADAVALSVVAPVDVAAIGRELAELRDLLPARMPLLLGGGGASSLGMAADAAGARVITDLAGFRAELRAIALARRSLRSP